MMSDETLAWHESGHAVIAAVLGCEVVTASLCPPIVLARGDGLDGACISLGGPCAEMLRFGYDRLNEHWANGWSGDLANARQRFDGPLGEAFRRADHLLRQHWGAVEAVADGLLTHGVLFGCEVEGLARAAGRPVWARPNLRTAAIRRSVPKPAVSNRSNSLPTRSPRRRGRAASVGFRDQALSRS